MAGEHEHYTAGSNRVVIELDDWRVCPMVCYDLRFPVWFRNRDDYDLLLCVANWPAARQSAWQTLLRARAIENQSYVVGVNILGVDGAGVRYVGGSAAHDAQGEFLLDAGTREGVFNLALDRQSLETHRTAFPAWQDADEYALAE
jgi:predicted amidohydrolase